MKNPSQKSLFIWSNFALFVFVCLYRDALIVGIVGGVVTITANWLFKLRRDEKQEDKINGTV